MRWKTSETESLNATLIASLEARRITPQVTTNWDRTWSQLLEKYRDIPALLEWALDHEFWSQVITTPHGFGRNLDRIRSQYAAGYQPSKPLSVEQQRIRDAGEPDYPPGLASDLERDAWRIAWNWHISRGSPPDQATERANADLGITATDPDVIDLDERRRTA